MAGSRRTVTTDDPIDDAWIDAIVEVNDAVAKREETSEPRGGSRRQVSVLFEVLDEATACGCEGDSPASGGVRGQVDEDLDARLEAMEGGIERAPIA